MAGAKSQSCRWSGSRGSRAYSHQRPRPAPAQAGLRELCLTCLTAVLAGFLISTFLPSGNQRQYLSPQRGEPCRSHSQSAPTPSPTTQPLSKMTSPYFN